MIKLSRVGNMAPNGVGVTTPPTVPEMGLELLARTADGLGIAIAVGVHGQDVSILQVWR